MPIEPHPIRPPYRIKSRTERTPCPIEFGESMTVQNAKDECDIEKIVKQYRRTRTITHVSDAIAKFGDFTQVTDFKQAIDQVLEAKAAFGELPSELRARFENDPAKLLAYMADPSNEEEAITLGLTPAKPVPTTPEEKQLVLPATPVPVVKTVETPPID